jgi:hypothetical protein
MRPGVGSFVRELERAGLTVVIGGSGHFRVSRYLFTFSGSPKCRYGLVNARRDLAKALSR